MYEIDTLLALRLLTPGVEDVEGATMEVEVEVSSTLSKWRLGHPMTDSTGSPAQVNKLT